MKDKTVTLSLSEMCLKWRDEGRNEVVEWIEGNIYKEITFDPNVKAYYISNKVWQAKLKEWGL